MSNLNKSKFWRWLTGAQEPPSPQTGQTIRLKPPLPPEIPLMLDERKHEMVSYLKKSHGWEMIHLGNYDFMVRRPDQGTSEMSIFEILTVARQMYAEDARRFLEWRDET